MQSTIVDSFRELSYYELFDIAERARWKMTELPWESFDSSQVNDWLIDLVKVMTIGECTTFSATRSFMDLFVHDLDFTQWLAVWFYEETKHPQALVKWLSLAGEKVSGQELLDARTITPMTPSAVEMLTFNIVSEIVAATLYSSSTKDITEPLIIEIMTKLSKDESRHSVGFEHYCKKYIVASSDPVKEKLVCLRSTWAFLENDNFVQHPVYITLNRLKGKMEIDVMDKIRKHLTQRISKVVGIPMNDPSKVYSIYKELKSSYKRTRKGEAMVQEYQL